MLFLKETKQKNNYYLLNILHKHAVYIEISIKS